MITEDRNNVPKLSSDSKLKATFDRFISTISFLGNLSNLFYFIMLPFISWLLSTILTYQAFRDLAGHPGGLLVILALVSAMLAAFGSISFGLFQRQKRFELGLLLDKATHDLSVHKRLSNQMAMVEEELLIRLARNFNDPEPDRRYGDLQEILRTLAVCCEQVLDPNADTNIFSVGVLQLNPKTKKFIKLADSSYAGSSRHFEEIDDLTYDNSTAGRSLRINETVVINDTQNSQEAGDGDWKHGNHRAICCTPVIVDIDRKFVIAITSSEKNVFDESRKMISRRSGDKARGVITALTVHQPTVQSIPFQAAVHSPEQGPEAEVSSI